MNIYEKIDKMFEANEKDDKEILQVILEEIAEIKQILKLNPKEYKKEYKKSLPDDFFEYVRRFKAEMKEDEIYGIYPEVEIDGLRIGVNSNGELYDKSNNKILPKYKSDAILEKLYNNYHIVKKIEDVI